MSLQKPPRCTARSWRSVFERSQLVEQELAIRKERLELFDRRYAEEMRVRDMRHGLHMLNERPDEECQVELSKVVDLGASALQLVIEERRAKAAGHASKKAPKHQEIEETDTVALELNVPMIAIETLIEQEHPEIPLPRRGFKSRVQDAMILIVDDERP